MKRRIALWLMPPLLLLAFVLYYPYSPAGQQERNMKLAKKHIAVHIAPKLKGDTRFAGVEVAVTTARLGSIVAVGVVRSEDDLRALREIVETARPPVSVRWAVEVGDGDW